MVRSENALEHRLGELAGHVVKCCHPCSGRESDCGVLVACHLVAQRAFVVDGGILGAERAIVGVFDLVALPCVFGDSSWIVGEVKFDSTARLLQYLARNLENLFCAKILSAWVSAEVTTKYQIWRPRRFS